MGRQRQEHPIPRGSRVQGEILHKRGVESGKYTEAKRIDEDITEWGIGRGVRREWKK